MRASHRVCPLLALAHAGEGQACVRVGHPQFLSLIRCQIRGSLQGQHLKEAVSSMKACMSLALCELCSAKERLYDPDLSVSEM